MTIERYIRAIAGSFVPLSLALDYLHSPWLSVLTIFDPRPAIFLTSIDPPLGRISQKH